MNPSRQNGHTPKHVAALANLLASSIIQEDSAAEADDRLCSKEVVHVGYYCSDCDNGTCTYERGGYDD